MTGSLKTKYCLKEERSSDRNSEIQLMDHSVIDWLNTGIYLRPTETRINHHHHFYSVLLQPVREKCQSPQDVIQAKECVWPPYPFIITHKTWSRLSKWVNKILDFAELRKELLILLWGGNPISHCQFRLITGCAV